MRTGTPANQPLRSDERVGPFAPSPVDAIDNPTFLTPGGLLMEVSLGGRIHDG